jgi:hypothetical protein
LNAIHAEARHERTSDRSEGPYRSLVSGIIERCRQPHQVINMIIMEQQSTTRDGSAEDDADGDQQATPQTGDEKLVTSPSPDAQPTTTTATTTRSSCSLIISPASASSITDDRSLQDSALRFAQTTRTTSPPIDSEVRRIISNDFLLLEDDDLESAFLPSFGLQASTPLLSGTSKHNNNHHQLKSKSTSNTPTLSLSFRPLSFPAIHSTFKSLNVQLQLALMLSVPWRGMSASASIPTGFTVAQQLGSSASHFVGRQHNLSSLRTSSLFVSALGLGVGLGVATFSCVGCYCVARLILPETRCFVVVTRQALAKAIAAGQRLVALVLVVREPRPPAHPGVKHASTNRIGCEELLLTPKTPKQIRRNSRTSSPHSSNGQLTHNSPHQSSPRLRRLPRGRGRGTSDALLQIITKSPDLAQELYEYQSPLTMINESSWAMMDSPTPSSIDERVQNVESNSTFAIPFSPPVSGWASPHRQSTFSTSSTIVPHGSPPRTHRASPLRDRSTSAVDRPSKRFSVNFPVHPSLPSRPPSWHTNPILSPEILASPTEGNFLTVLAHQERRVLELKDELRRAEDELNKLKRQWATIEVSRSQQHTRAEAQAQLTPVQTTLSMLEGTHVEPLDSGSWIQREMDRRKNLVGPARSSGRKVFSGSRHTRTLSLLSPDKTTTPQQFPMSSPRKKPAGLKLNTPLSAVERPTPFFDSTKTVVSPVKDDLFNELASTPKDAILRTGKQMIGDIKDGLWTFVEDIRQATIGDEAIHGTNPRTTSGTPGTPSVNRTGHKTVHERRLARHSTALATIQPRAAPHSMTYDTLLDGVQGAFWRENGLGIDTGDENSTVVKPKSYHRKDDSRNATIRSSHRPTPQKPKDIEDNWDTWSTPAKPATSSTASPISALSHIKSPSESTSSSDSTVATQDGSGPSSPNQTLTPHTLTPKSASHPPNLLEPIEDGRNSKRSSGVWASQLAKIAPAGVEQLKRTASQIMADWERGVAANSPSGGGHHSPTQ